MQSYVIGVDEAGRGPLAGPVAVGAVLLKVDFDWSCLPGVADSKKLTGNRREAIFEATRSLKQQELLDFQVALVSAAVIDRIGIVPAVKRGIERTLRSLTVRNQITSTEAKILLDGALKAPEPFTYQETIIRGDASEKCIGLASIMAKVMRDRYMTQVAGKYPEYVFEKHKGYGTKEHRKLIGTHGLSDIHRVSFCSRLKNGGSVV